MRYTASGEPEPEHWYEAKSAEGLAVRLEAIVSDDPDPGSRLRPGTTSAILVNEAARRIREQGPKKEKQDDDDPDELSALLADEQD